MMTMGVVCAFVARDDEDTTHDRTGTRPTDRRRRRRVRALARSRLDARASAEVGRWDLADRSTDASSTFTTIVFIRN